MVRNTLGLRLRAEVDVAILGAGPTGSVAALELGRAGLSVALIDPGVPDHGHQIESFPAAGAPLAEAVGLLAPICSTAEGPAVSMQLYWRDTPEKQDFNDAGPLLLHRFELHQILLEQALVASSDTTHIKARVRRQVKHNDIELIETTDGKVQARMVLDARGRVGGRRLGAEQADSDALVALPFSATLPSQATSDMTLEAMPTAWLWVARLAGGEVHGAVFQRASTLAGLTLAQRTKYAERCLSKSQSLSEISRIHILRPQSAEFAALLDPVKSPTSIAIGDAALARDPIASHGLVHAMRSAVQAAAAVRTILDPQQASDAAFSFLRHKHNQALKNARLSTARAYADQSLFDTPFWRRSDLEESSYQTPAISLSEPLQLARPLTRAPVLSDSSISWVPAIALPLIDDFAVMIGRVAAVDIATACQPPTTLPELAERLSAQHDRASVMAALEHLIKTGALAHKVRVEPV